MAPVGADESGVAARSVVEDPYGDANRATLALWTTLTFVTAGALVALNEKLGEATVVALAVAAGVLHGFVNGSTVAPGGSSALALGGATSAVFCVVALLAAEVMALPAGWPRVAVRVGGSWLVAAGLLMLGWLARSPG